MPTIYPLLGEPYEISEDENATIRETYKAEFEDSRKRREQRAPEAKGAADYQAALDGIDKALSPPLTKELAAENRQTRVTAKAKTDFKMFQACCSKWGLPDLPAPPQAVAVFLSEESEHGAAHVSRLARSISIVHTACNFSDPTTDILVRAILRLVRSEKKSSPQKG